MLFAKLGVITHLYSSLEQCQKSCSSVISGSNFWHLPSPKGNKTSKKFICNVWIAPCDCSLCKPEYRGCFLLVPPGGHTTLMVQGRGGAEVSPSRSPSALTQVCLAFKGGNKTLLKPMAKSSFSCSAPLRLHLNLLISLKSKGTDERSA